jgi:hypothetical protein
MTYWLAFPESHGLVPPLPGSGDVTVTNCLVLAYMHTHCRLINKQAFLVQKYLQVQFALFDQIGRLI